MKVNAILRLNYKKTIRGVKYYTLDGKERRLFVPLFSHRSCTTVHIPTAIFNTGYHIITYEVCLEYG